MFRQGGGSFIITAVVALALGIGANTAIFSLVNTVLMKEPPFPKADRIVILKTKTPQGSFQGGSPAKLHIGRGKRTCWKMWRHLEAVS
jgi:putative ABC transport system permease protein